MLDLSRRIAFAPSRKAFLNAGRIQIDRLAVTPLAERIGQPAQVRHMPPVYAGSIVPRNLVPRLRVADLLPWNYAIKV